MSQGDWMDSLDHKVFPFVKFSEYENRYPTREGCGLREEAVSELRSASGALFQIFKKVLGIAQRDDILEELEVPPKARAFLWCKNAMQEPTWLSRFDFVMDCQGRFHMVEINADTPCAVVEAFYGNRIYCDAFRLEDPNAGSYNQLKGFLRKVFMACYHPTVNISRGRFTAERPFVFSCFDDYIEDYGTTMFLMNAMKEACAEEQPFYSEGSIEFVSFYDLQIVDDTGDVLLPDQRRAIALYFFTKEEASIVRKYMLPTYFERKDIGTVYARKPIWGREGWGITVEQFGTQLMASRELEDGEIQKESKKAIYQEFVHQPTVRLQTDEGTGNGYLTLSCFLLGNQPSALYARYSPLEIAGTEAFWAPLYVDRHR